MLKKKNLSIVLLGLILGFGLVACSGGGVPLASKGLKKVPAGFGSLSHCTLIDLSLTTNGASTPDAGFERMNRTMVWHFTVSNTQLQSKRKGPGDPIIINIPVIQISPNKIIAQGPTKAVVGRQKVRIEISRKGAGRKNFLVRQKRTLVMDDKFVDTWTLHCKANG